ncbi:MAG: HIT domain-containing protein [Rhodococcus sp. (in: high G+C Gram-positive bacteria)]
MTPCIFCAIVAAEAPSTVVLDTEDVLAFLDIRPVTTGHVLVIPKQHFSDLDSMPPAAAAAVFAAGQRISKAMRRSDLRADGVNLVVNDGKSAFQTVFHSHLHVVPRRTGDKLRFVAGFVTRRLRDAEGTATSIRAGLDRLAHEESR